MKYLKYLVVLIASIFAGTFKAVKTVIATKGRPETETVSCTLSTDKPFQQMLICSGITLTPGTLVSRKEGRSIDVLKFADGDTAPHAVFDRIFGG